MKTIIHIILKVSGSEARHFEGMVLANGRYSIEIDDFPMMWEGESLDGLGEDLDIYEVRYIATSFSDKSRKYECYDHMTEATRKESHQKFTNLGFKWLEYNQDE